MVLRARMRTLNNEILPYEIGLPGKNGWDFETADSSFRRLVAVSLPSFGRKKTQCIIYDVTMLQLG